MTTPFTVQAEQRTSAARTVQLLLAVILVSRNRGLNCKTPDSLHAKNVLFCVAAQVSYLVLDEADKMLGLGFQPQIEQLKQHLLPPAEQEGIAKKQKKMRRVQVGRGSR